MISGYDARGLFFTNDFRSPTLLTLSLNVEIKQYVNIFISETA
jgi:hypothetical protein